MTDPRGAVIFLICLGVLTLLFLLCAIARRLWWTEAVQSWKLRWTGESSYLPYLPYRQDWTPRGRHPSGPIALRGDRKPLVGEGSSSSARAQAPALDSRSVGAVPVSDVVRSSSAPAPSTDTGTQLVPEAARSVSGPDVVPPAVPDPRVGDTELVLAAHPSEVRP